jgi:phage gp16-like protein
MPTRADLAKIHIAAKEIGLDDEGYRHLLADRYRVESARELTPRQVADLLAHFRRLGWQARPGRQAKEKSGSGSALASDPQSRKIRALWITLHKAGVVRDPSESALAAYVQRMTKSRVQPQGVAALQWCDGAQKHRIIEALKEWGKRTRVDG